MRKTFTKMASSFMVVAMTVSTVVPMMPVVTANAAPASYSVKTVSYAYKEQGNTATTVDIDIVTNPGDGPVLGLLHNTGGAGGSNEYLLEVKDGDVTYAFKDLDKDGQLDTFEDWRLDNDQRAGSLAKELAATDAGIRQIAGLMLFSSHETNLTNGLTTSQKNYLTNSSLRNILNAAGNNVEDAVRWSNAVQAYVEKSGFNVPVNFSSDPRSTAGSGDIYSGDATGSQISLWPANIGLAATFSEEHMYNFAKATSAEYRALGIQTALGPQIDLATDPRWLRFNGTFGEDTQLAADMAQAYADGSQSSYDKEGNDLGWGPDSINVMIKHFPGDGAGEGGRESHTDPGKYAVYPSGNTADALIPFTEGGLKLRGATGESAAVMTSYSIGIAADGSPAFGNDRVGSAYSKAKMDILREQLKYDGVICTDWNVTQSGFMGMAWGAEDLTTNERFAAILETGHDMFGGVNSASGIVGTSSSTLGGAYDIIKTNHGEAYARLRFEVSGKRLLKLTMNAGLFENPYLDLENSKKIAGSKDKIEMGYEAQLDSVVLLKNANDTIKPASQKKRLSTMTVYIPMTYREGEPSIFGTPQAAWEPTVNLDIARSIYGTVLTDIEVQPDQYMTPDLSNVDLVIAGMRSPGNGGIFSNTGVFTKPDGSNGYYPISLQYNTYRADGPNVRKVSIAGDILADGSQENRSYFGETSRILNSYDLTATLNAVNAVAKTGKDIPIVVALNVVNPTVVKEFEGKVDAIVAGFSVSDKAMLDVINGNHEPAGLLPAQFPKDMNAVEAQLEDTGRDMVPYTDTEGNTYDFAYGLNWSGQIKDARVKKYNPELLDQEPEEKAGWVVDGSNWKYREADGKFVANNWKAISGEWYYFNADTYMATGWNFIGGAWYFMAASGEMQTDWVHDGSKWYFMVASGEMQIGWIHDGDGWYFMAASGEMQTGWIHDGANWYYMETSGTMVANKWVGDYYLLGSGAMATNQWIGNYYVGADGKWDASRIR